MKKSFVLAFIFLSFSSKPKCQSNDTLSAKITEIKTLKKCLLIKGISSFNNLDTIVLISEKRNHIRKKKQKIEVGNTYLFIAEKDIIVGSPTKKFSVEFKNTTVWTNKESYKLKPRLCLNCIDRYIK